MASKKSEELVEKYIADNQEFWVQTVKTPMVDNSGEVSGILGIFWDITDRKRAEEQIKTSLLEKETLLQEVHHRVKNNMQIIASLLKLQIQKQENKSVQDILRENIARVYAMSAIHENLYQSEILSEIDFKAYATKIMQMLLQTYGVSPNRVKIVIHSPDLRLSIEKANPLGLVLNELVSNALKHAFPNEVEGEINLQINKHDKEIVLTVQDNGIGVPEDFDLHHCGSLGLELVYTLVENQLGGTIKMLRDNGTTFTIKFNIEK